MSTQNALQLDPTGLLSGAVATETPGTTAAASSSPTMPQSEEDRVLEAGKALIANLMADRLTTAYLSTTAKYQQGIERKAFEEMVGKFPLIRGRLELPQHQEHNVRKSPDSEGYAYYCTAHQQTYDPSGPGNGPKVNFVMSLKLDGDAWKVDSLEIEAKE